MKSSSLFVSYLKATLGQLGNIELGETLTVQVFGETEQFKVTGIEPVEGPRKIVTRDTDLQVAASLSKEEEGSDDGVDDIEKMMAELKLRDSEPKRCGGFLSQRELLDEVIRLKLKGGVNIKGVLVHGPSGIGKTIAVETVLSSFSALHKLVITPKHLVQSGEGPAMVKKLQDAFKLAKMRQPSVLVVEEVDFLAGKKEGRELYYTFMAELDAIESSRQMLVIATTNKLDEVDKSLRRGGRLDIDIRFEMPSAEDRHQILKLHLESLLKTSIEIRDEDLLYIARAASGFVSSDLAQIVRNAHLKALKSGGVE